MASVYTILKCHAPGIQYERQLKAKTQDEGDDTFDKRLAVAKQLKVGRFALKIDGDGPVFAGLADGVLHGPPSGQMVEAADDPRWGVILHHFKGIAKASGVYH